MPSLTSPGRCPGGAPPQPALGTTKIFSGTRICMGKLKNVPTATKRSGWTARTAGSGPGRPRDRPRGPRAAAERVARACRATDGVRARAGESCHRGSQGVTGGCTRWGSRGRLGSRRAHRASQGTRGTPGTWPTHGVTQGQMSEAVLRYPHQRRKFLSRLYVLTSSSEADNWSSYHNATYP